MAKTTTTGARQQREAIEEFLRFVTNDGSFIELRAFGAEGKKFSGIFDNRRDFAKNAAAMDAQGLTTATYFTLNPISEKAILNPKGINIVNRKPYRTTRDCDIDRRRLYLIDIDPTRPSGVSATDEEKAHALVIGTRICEYLTARGWPEPICIDSGNGLHLLYKGDGCGASSKAWAHVLKHLDQTFSTDAAKVDTSVGNAARISRLPGTWNRKGTDSPERPHRLAGVISYPVRWEPLLHGLIYRLATQTGYESPSDRVQKYGRNKPKLLIDEAGVHRLIEEYPDHLHLAYGAHRDDGVYFFLAECPFNGAAHRDQMGKTAIILRDDHIGFNCFSDDCHDHTFGELLKLLHKGTGRRPSMPVWESSTELKDWHYEVWGLDSPRILDYMERQEALLKQTPEWKYDSETWEALNSPEFAKCPLGTDPAEWGLKPGTVTADFVLRAMEELKTLTGDAWNARYQVLRKMANDRDEPAMGQYLGRESLFTLARRQSWASDTGEVPRDRIIGSAEFKFRLGSLTPADGVSSRRRAGNALNF